MKSIPLLPSTKCFSSFSKGALASDFQEIGYHSISSPEHGHYTRMKCFVLLAVIVNGNTLHLALVLVQTPEKGHEAVLNEEGQAMNGACFVYRKLQIAVS